MARIRTIKPEFQNSQSMGRVSRDARLTFVELWPQCDDAGRIRANSRMLASVLFPYDEDAPKLIDGWLTELENEGCIVRYRVENDEYLAIVHWDHQKIDHPQPSKLPAPQAKKRAKTKLSVREQSSKPREDSSVVRAVSSTVSGPVSDQDQGSVSEGASRNAIVRADADGFEAFWIEYPRKVAKPKASKAYAAARAKASAETILAGAQRYRREREGEDETYTAHPASWLNAERWNDPEKAPSNERSGNRNPQGSTPNDRALRALARVAGIEPDGDREQRHDPGSSGGESGQLALMAPAAA